MFQCGICSGLGHIHYENHGSEPSFAPQLCDGRFESLGTAARSSPTFDPTTGSTDLAVPASASHAATASPPSNSAAGSTTGNGHYVHATWTTSYMRHSYATTVPSTTCIQSSHIPHSGIDSDAASINYGCSNRASHRYDAYRSSAIFSTVHFSHPPSAFSFNTHHSPTCQLPYIPTNSTSTKHAIYTQHLPLHNH